MRCDNCGRRVPDGATVWRVSLGYSATPSVQSWCAACGTDFARKWLPPDLEDWFESDRQRLLARHAAMWHPEQPCDHCGRPIIFDTSRRIPQHAVCGSACRYAVKLAQVRTRNARCRPQTTCRTCGCKLFPPKRAHARFCSAACRQRAYRQRQQAEAA
jgi:hypothetical protein